MNKVVDQENAVGSPYVGTGQLAQRIHNAHILFTRGEETLKKREEECPAEKKDWYLRQKINIPYFTGDFVGANKLSDDDEFNVLLGTRTFLIRCPPELLHNLLGLRRAIILEKQMLSDELRNQTKVRAEDLCTEFSLYSTKLRMDQYVERMDKWTLQQAKVELANVLLHDTVRLMQFSSIPNEKDFAATSSFSLNNLRDVGRVYLENVLIKDNRFALGGSGDIARQIAKFLRDDYNENGLDWVPTDDEDEKYLCEQEADEHHIIHDRLFRVEDKIIEETQILVKNYKPIREELYGEKKTFEGKSLKRKTPQYDLDYDFQDSEFKIPKLDQEENTEYASISSDVM